VKASSCFHTMRGLLQVAFISRRAKMMPGTMGSQKVQPRKRGVINSELRPLCEGVAAIGDTLDGPTQFKISRIVAGR